MADKAKKTMVAFTCEDCTDPFLAPQGSRRHYCNKCLVKRVIDGLGKGGRPKKEK